ncbi:FecR family protein [Larkinella knui]|uniref:FecR family protein n=1 Tax=Larkinella knui TaxID=2025310 RepID=A0A3P1CKS5_9BACT|nr:FecR family protein [Larkinella knui]RRB13859.1 FecR family protein [Larkinella knui]
MDYIHYSAEDFIVDDYFRKWVNGQLPQEDTFWPEWVRHHPEKEALISQAKFVLKALEMKHIPITDAKVSDKVRQMLEETDAQLTVERSFWATNWWKLAAAVVLVLGISGYFLNQKLLNPTRYDELVMAQANPTIEKVNNSNQPIKISLSDGSIITLQPKSKLSYPETFAKEARTVFLSGEGFFDIAKNPRKPFLVYANELVTKVLGTSFSIRAFEKDKDVVVKVFTGKVSVLSGKEAVHTASQPFSQTDGVILMPNQMVIYERTPDKLTKTLVENPKMIVPQPIDSNPFNFQNTPVSQTFEVLEKGYGVPILYDEEVLKNCTVTAPLGSESLYEKLDIICKVIRATYEVVDAQIIITSKGCK